MQTMWQERFISLRKKVLEKEFANMNDRQKEAVFQVKGPLLILAGAGSGKTTVLVNRVANLVKYGDAYQSEWAPDAVTEEDMAFLEDTLAGRADDPDRLRRLLAVRPAKPWNVMAITFTNKAAGELKERLANMLGEEAQDIMASTFHSACVRMLRRDIERLGYNRSFTIYDADDQQRIIKDCIRTLQIDEKMFPPKSMANAIGRAKDQLITPESFSKMYENEYRMSVIAKIYTAYQQKLRQADALDFDDIIMLTVKLLEEHPDVLEYYQNRYRYIMVDEYQDTNIAQYKLVSLLSSAHQNLCVVGDDDQSIYRFRGATIENILCFETQFSNAKVIRLEQNYRSTQRILDAANAVIAHNKERKGKNLWTSNGEGEQIVVYRSTDDFKEAAFVADTVLENVGAGAKFSDHAVLYRNNAQSNNIERYFVKSSIPYRIIGGLRFYERKEIKDIIAYLSVLNNPADTLRLSRIINEPKRGIGAATVATAAEIAGTLGVSLFEVLENADAYAALARKSAALKQFAGMMRAFMDRLDSEPMHVIVNELLEESGYLRYIKSLGEEGETRLENIKELVSNIVKYEQENEEATLSGFLEEVALFTDLDNYDPNTDAVILMTMHAAKGLEFPYVFIVGMEEGILPGIRAIGNEEDIEEERRLVYVGITRAKKQLYLTAAASRMLYGSTSRNRLSRFLEEIPKEYKDFQDGTVTVSKIDPSTYVAANRGASRKVARTLGISGQSAAVATGVQYDIGDIVVHRVFGEGKVLSATAMGNDVLVEVSFSGFGVKKIMANFAKLEKH